MEKNRHSFVIHSGDGHDAGAQQKLGAISVHFSGHKKSRKRLFFNDLRLPFCGERGIRTPGTVTRTSV